MREEATDRRPCGARRAMPRRCAQRLGIEPELVVREGKPTEEIHKLIEEDQDIAILVLAAGAAQGRSGTAGRLDRRQGRGLPHSGHGGAAESVGRGNRQPRLSRNRSRSSLGPASRGVFGLKRAGEWAYLELFQTRLQRRCGDVHPDRGDPESRRRLKFLPGSEVLAIRHRRFPRRRSGARGFAARRPAVRHSGRHRRVLRLRFRHRDQGRPPTGSI